MEENDSEKLLVDGDGSDGNSYHGNSGNHGNYIHHGNKKVHGNKDRKSVHVLLSDSDAIA